jgi:hypothetical protein
MADGSNSSSSDVRYKANKEQNQEDEEANPGNLSSSESHYSKTKDASQQCDHKEEQRVIQHCHSFLSRGFLTRRFTQIATLVPASK